MGSITFLERNRLGKHPVRGVDSGRVRQWAADGVSHNGEMRVLVILCYSTDLIGGSGF